MNFEFIPVDYDYFDFNSRNYIRLIGRNEKGEKVCLVDSYEPNFWIILEDGAKPDKIIKELNDIEIDKGSRSTKILSTNVSNKNYLGKEVKAIQVFIENHKDAQEFASATAGIEGILKRREHDVSITTKYIKEKGIEPLTWYNVDADILGLDEYGGIAQSLDLKNCFFIKSTEKIENKNGFKPKILAYDIETNHREIGKGEILMISLYGEGVKKVFTWKNCESAQDYVEFFKDEADMIEAFAAYVNNVSPDIITGYFSDGFDLPYLKARAEKNKIDFHLGLDGRSPSFGRGRISSGKIAGIVHVDLYRFIDAVFSQYLQSETLSLNEVAKELIGEEKEDFDFKRLASMEDSDWKDFFSYNLQDSVATWKLAEKIWPDIYEFCKIIKEPIFNVTRDRMSAHVENHIIHNLDRFNEIIERRPGHNESNERKMKGKFEGAFVFEPIPGFYKDIVMFDFTSMHASIIVSFNISKSTIVEDEDAEDVFESPFFDLDGFHGKVCFERKRGFFATLLSEVVEKRKQYKTEYNNDKNAMTKARSNAYKLLANATFGYQGFFGARYYSRQAAAATLAFVRKFTRDTIERIEKGGHKIIYSDTDSIAFLQGAKDKNQVP